MYTHIIILLWLMILNMFSTDFVKLSNCEQALAWFIKFPLGFYKFLMDLAFIVFQRNTLLSLLTSFHMVSVGFALVIMDTERLLSGFQLGSIGFTWWVLMCLPWIQIGPQSVLYWTFHRLYCAWVVFDRFSICSTMILISLDRLLIGFASQQIVKHVLTCSSTVPTTSSQVFLILRTNAIACQFFLVFLNSIFDFDFFAKIFIRESIDKLPITSTQSI